MGYGFKALTSAFKAEPVLIREGQVVFASPIESDRVELRLENGSTVHVKGSLSEVCKKLGIYVAED